MLPLQLLRVRTRKGAIFPLFCTDDDHYGNYAGLAQKIIEEFKESAKKRERKKQLSRRLAEIEASHDDYKLVRGLGTLLERRSRFEAGASGSDGTGTGTSASTSASIIGSQSTAGDAVSSARRVQSSIDPASIRRALFEESSRTGFALTEGERDSLIQSVASKMEIAESQLRANLWSDLEDNMVLVQFDPITPEELLGWYNLSLMQTLLFNCTSLEFTIRNGINWKQVLRSVKRLGLMYELQQRPKAVRNGEDKTRSDASITYAKDNSTTTANPKTTANSNNNNNSTSTPSFESADTTELVCMLDGPLSLFKLTERYGTSIAKILPFIISTEKWHLHAWIIRKNMSGKKMFEFTASSSDVPMLLSSPHFPNSEAKRGNHQVQFQGFPRGAGDTMRLHSFDSIVEEKFASRFEQLDIGWVLTREPDPIVVTGGRAFIPDFMFEKYGRKVYLEIVGFWTARYLENKKKKLLDALVNRNVDLFIAINEDLECSKITSSKSIPPERVIIYRNDSVPVKPIIAYLKEIDRQEIEKHALDANLKIRFDKTKADVVSIEQVARDRDIPVESAIRVAARDNNDDYLQAGKYFIQKSLAEKMDRLLNGVTRFSEACTILSENSIPESCQAELVSILGYKVVWQSMDATSALIVKHKQFNTNPKTAAGTST